MKPQLLKVSTGPASSFSVRQDLVPYINNQWHYHAEVELIHLKDGLGTQFIGDNIRRFMPGDVMIVGAHLPHYWRFDEQYFEEGNSMAADVRVAHFCNNFWGDQFLQLPENRNVKLLLDKAKYGLLLTDATEKKIVADILEKMLTADGTKRVTLLLQALLIISNSSQLKLLSSIGFRYDFKESEKDRINAIYEYTISNFKNKIQLDEIASIAHICPNSFCRYFKSRTRKTYSQFLIEIKVGNACKLLIENKMSIKRVCGESGFNSFSSFHKYFKKITGKSPVGYQNEFTNKASRR